MSTNAAFSPGLDIETDNYFNCLQTNWRVSASQGLSPRSAKCSVHRRPTASVPDRDISYPISPALTDDRTALWN